MDATLATGIEEIVCVSVGADELRNFYVESIGEDAVGGVFIPLDHTRPAGSSFQILVCLPGDLCFRAQFCVRWSRPVESSTTEGPAGVWGVWMVESTDGLRALRRFLDIFPRLDPRKRG